MKGTEDVKRLSVHHVKCGEGKETNGGRKGTKEIKQRTTTKNKLLHRIDKKVNINQNKINLNTRQQAVMTTNHL
jgi:hypothetical protein